jgi:translation initiation factor eIF-2B subunit gamma
MPGGASLPFQVVILAGGENKKLFPLTSGGVKALIPIGNRPLISYTLRLIEQAGISQAVVVSRGAPPLRSWRRRCAAHLPPPC